MMNRYKRINVQQNRLMVIHIIKIEKIKAINIIHSDKVRNLLNSI